MKNSFKNPMKTFTLICAISLSSLLTINAYANAENVISTSEKSEASKTLNEFKIALKNADKEKVMAILSPEITIYEAGYVERSRQEYVSHHMEGDMKFAQTSTQKVLNHTEKMSGDTAIIWQETETKANLKGKDVTILGTTTAILKKTNGRWKIEHIHWSSRKPT